MKTHSYTSGSVVKGLLRYVGPFMAGMILQNLYGAVDLWVVGHFATTADVSAVTIGSQLMSVITQMILGFATGTTVLVGQFFGAGETKKLGQTVGTSILLFSGVAAVLTTFFVVFHKWIITAMRTPAEAVAPARSYLFICSVGIVFIVGFNVVSSILMGMGDTKTPLLFMAVACVTNIAGDLILVRMFYMGAAGAAIATAAAQGCAFLFSLLYLKKKGLGFPFSASDIKFNKHLMSRTVQVGAPVAVQDVLVNLSFLFITAIINQMGLAASAAAGVVEKLFTFLMMPAISCGAAVSTIAAQNLGAGKPKRAISVTWCASWMALVPSVAVVVFCQLGGELLTRWFSTDPEVVRLAALYLRTYCLDTLVCSFVFCLNGYFNSCGYAWFTLVHSLTTTFALRLPITWWVSRMEGATLLQMGWAAPISTLGSMVLCIIFYLWMQRHKKGMHLTGQEQSA